MQIKIGEKIRELRRRDGRTQEEMAAAIGVTSQAVSRWEAGGGYPDMETVPALANYFHISIDELFGYQNEREERIGEILRRAEESFRYQERIDENIALLRDAVEEFPAESRLWARLGWALNMKAYDDPGLRKTIDPDSGVSKYDTEHNGNNPYIKEALAVWERAVDMELPSRERREIMPQMVLSYTITGDTEKAKALAETQDFIESSRETLMWRAADGEERLARQEEALISLIYSLCDTVSNMVWSHKEFCRTDAGIDLLRTTAEYAESIIGDGKCGVLHMKIALLWEACALWSDPSREDTRDFAQRYLYHSRRIDDEVKYSSPLTARAVPAARIFPAGPSSEIMIERFKNKAPAELLAGLCL